MREPLPYLLQKTLDCFVAFSARNGTPPSIVDLQHMLRYASDTSVMRNLRELIRLKYLAYKPGHRRLSLRGPARVVPVADRVAVVAGQPMTSQQAIVLASELLACQTGEINQCRSRQEPERKSLVPTLPS